MTRAGDVVARVAGLPFDDVAAALDAKGYAHLGRLLTPAECEHVAALYASDARFRSRVVMERHGVSEVRSGTRCTLGLIFHDAA